jgi:lysophospholipase L1-like esterase
MLCLAVPEVEETPMKRMMLALCVGLLSMAAIPGGTVSVTQASAYVGPKAYYLALGDSLAFGYQPNLVFNQGYADDFSANLKSHGGKYYTNMGCAGETTTTFLNGGCPYWYLRKTFYTGSQMKAALSFLKSHSGQVSPVTLDIGANDLLPDVDGSTCAISPNWTNDLATFNTNFVNIVNQLSSALNGKGDLIVMNYYDPYQNQCSSNPQVLSDIELVNSDIQSDLTGTPAHLVDVFTAFGGATTPNANICNYTWMCSSYNDIHATQTGYSVIAGAFESTSGY